MDDKSQAFRQPLVTATGIILGFILNFSATFVKSESIVSDLVSYLIGVFMLTGIICLIAVLYRALKMNTAEVNKEKYYQKTLKLFIFGISISFAGVLIDMFTNFVRE
ncbi:MAG TPA: hypothetical protein PKO18_02110 [Chitinophagales bacterium]|nr:hypothetical protein [Chitinophagales bacterium]